jgi:hypothetical protein
MGIGCEYAQPGDKIRVFLRVRGPVILRPMGFLDRFLELCNVHQPMKGEAMELKTGMLPEEWLTLR